MRIEGLRAPKLEPDRWVRPARYAAATALLLLLGATGSIVVVDVMHWREAVTAARKVALNPYRSERERVDALFVLQRDVLESVRILQTIAASDQGTASESARVALANIERSAQR